MKGLIFGEWRGGLRGILRGLGWMGLRLTLLFFLLGELGGWWWVFDLLSNFRLQYVMAGLVLTGLGMAAGSWRLAAAAGLFVVILGWTLVPYYVRGEGDGEPEGLGLLSFNVHYQNERHDEVIELIRELAPDILILTEVTRRWMRALEVLEGEYVLRCAQPREGTFGIAAWTRVGVEAEAEIVEIGGTGLPSVVMRLDLPEFRGVLIGSHPPPPGGRQMARDRDTQLAALAELAGELGGGRSVVAGDFNASPWSRGMAPFDRAGLRDARLGYGIYGTWRREIPLVAVPIDSAWVGPEVGVRDVRVLPSCGSDHNAIFLRMWTVE